MTSAFGVEHEFSKALKLSNLVRPGTTYTAPGRYANTGVPVKKPGVSQSSAGPRMTGKQVRTLRSTMRQGKHGMPSKR